MKRPMRSGTTENTRAATVARTSHFAKRGNKA